MNPETAVHDLRVAALIGSVRDGRFGARIGAWVHDRLTGAGLDVDLLDLAATTIPHSMGADEDFASLTERIGRADALIVITPEYNHSYPGRSRPPSTCSGPNCARNRSDSSPTAGCPAACVRSRPCVRCSRNCTR
nr:NAD(P)H-dependent oxidoreductase [Nocardia cyriacigeorgica]